LPTSLCCGRIDEKNTAARQEMLRAAVVKYFYIMKETEPNFFGKILPYVVFILLLPLSLIYMTITAVVNFIRKIFQR
jgi:hypothetical protein